MDYSLLCLLSDYMIYLSHASISQVLTYQLHFWVILFTTWKFTKNLSFREGEGEKNIESSMETYTLPNVK